MVSYTPDYIGGPDELPPGSVFVFGSNTEGRHGAGSARVAMDRFGAIYGQAHGRQGMSYAICTTDLGSERRFMLETIEAQIREFLLYASWHPLETFYVTKVGTLRAGYTVGEVAALWKGKAIPANVILPKEFSDEG